jgi:hypothetical protein
MAEHKYPEYYDRYYVPTLKAVATVAKRRRKPFEVMVADRAVGGKPCAHCGIALRDPYYVNEGCRETTTDKPHDLRGEGAYRRVTYYPSVKGVLFEHYYCGWAHTLKNVFALAHRLGY